MDPREQLITQIQQASHYIKEQTDEKPLIGIVLGSGLSSIAEILDKATKIPYIDIPYFPEATTTGHEGSLTIGKIGGINIAAMQGRFHLYEGYTMWGITLPIRVLAYLGCKSVIITNGAGGLDNNMKPGSLMVIKDHIDLIQSNPLAGPEVEELGPRFVSMGDAYNKNLISIVKSKAKELKIDLSEGVYVGVKGPSYETPAEVKFLKIIGGKAVGMSTVPEVIVARQQELNVLGLSVITNNALKQKHVNHKEVLAVVDKIKAKLEQLLIKTIKEMGERKNEL